jgi:cell division protein FtsW
MLRAGHVIALAVIALLTLGVVMVNSAGMAVTPVTGVSALSSDATTAPASAGITWQGIVTSRSSVYMVLAIVAMGVAAWLPIHRFAGHAQLGVHPSGWDDPQERLATYRWLLVGAAILILICALAYVPGIASPRKGANRWIAVPGLGGGEGGLSMQPSEIAKWGLAALIAWYAAARGSNLARFGTGLIPALIAIAAVAGFVVIEDLGTGVLIAAVACIVLLAGGARFWQFMLFTPIAAAGVVYAILTSEYRVKRILAFIDPYADPQGIGYHTIQSLVAVAGGEGFGRGLGHGLQKFGYLPEDRTDFLFAIICEELGIAGAGLVITLFLTLLFAGITIAARERSPMLRLFTLGVIATVCLQAIINLAVVTGLAPTKGIALPLLSSGGTGWILTAFSLGLLIAIDRGNAGYAALESGSVDDLNLAPAASSVTPSPEARATQPADVPSAA